jgi:hypothetical protein
MTMSSTHRPQNKFEGYCVISVGARKLDPLGEIAPPAIFGAVKRCSARTKNISKPKKQDVPRVHQGSPAQPADNCSSVALRFGHRLFIAAINAHASAENTQPSCHRRLQSRNRPSPDHQRTGDCRSIQNDVVSVQDANGTLSVPDMTPAVFRAGDGDNHATPHCRSRSPKRGDRVNTLIDDECLVPARGGQMRL